MVEVHIERARLCLYFSRSVSLAYSYLIVCHMQLLVQFCRGERIHKDYVVHETCGRMKDYSK